MFVEIINQRYHLSARLSANNKSFIKNQVHIHHWNNYQYIADSVLFVEDPKLVFSKTAETKSYFIHYKFLDTIFVFFNCIIVGIVLLCRYNVICEWDWT